MGIFCKAVAVVESCTTIPQLKVAFAFVLQALKCDRLNYKDAAIIYRGKILVKLRDFGGSEESFTKMPPPPIFRHPLTPR